MKPKILVVDDEPDALDVVGFKIKEAGMTPIFAHDGAHAIVMAREERPALIVLDLMLPAVDGLEVCKILRRDPKTTKIPILMLTAKATELDRVIGLELGAADYVTKPFSPRELILRIKNLLSRPLANESCFAFTGLKLDGLEINVPGREILVDGRPAALTATEFDLLTVLARQRGLVHSRAELLEEVLGYDHKLESRTVDTHMTRLREKLGRGARYLETVRGQGYKFSKAE